MTEALWKPSEKNLRDSNMAQFMKSVNVSSYDALYRWSIEHPELFWKGVWDFCGIKASKQARSVVRDIAQMPGAVWFEGAELNFAENLLRFNDEKTAITFTNENGLRKSLTYHELNQEVAKASAAFREMGVRVGDRVAGFLPNIPETVIAMLATASIGATWSSCSPDFGIAGALERFKQIEPKLLIAADGYYYNGKQINVMDKIDALIRQISSIQKTVIVPYCGNVEINNSITNWNSFSRRKPQTINFEQTPFNHPLYIMYSSGTTGKPKCIVHGAGGTLIQHLKELVLHTDLTRNDVIFYYTTCGWMMWNWLVSSLATGATIVLYDGSPIYPDKERLFDLIDQEKISVFGVSSKYLSTLEKSDCKLVKTHELNSLRSILSTGSSLLPEQFNFVYRYIKKDVQLSSISGGTDIISCFALGNPVLPVYRGELQGAGLGMKIEIFDEQGTPQKETKGELVCTLPFPSMPIYFWNDKDNKKYHHAYFEKYSNVWAQGDYAEITKHNGLIIYGRSDTILNPGGIRIGTAEIYQEVEKIDGVLESVAVTHNDHIILFVRLKDGCKLDETLSNTIKSRLKNNASPHHVPKHIFQVDDIPKTINGKIAEIAVRKTVNGESVTNIDALSNPESLHAFKLMQLRKA